MSPARWHSQTVIGGSCLSQEDREKWQRKYQQGAYTSRRHPAWYLQQQLPMMTPPGKRALDLACGAGRNALYLAGQGYRVDALDIAAEALQRGEIAAMNQELDGIRWHEHDLDTGLPVWLNQYDLVIMVRYLDIALLQAAARSLVKGGYLLAEVHLRTDVPVAGPDSNRFRAEPGALKRVAAGMDVIDYFEGIVSDPDGSTVALARLLARAR